MRSLRKIVEIDEELCNGCGQCVSSCAEAALEIVDGKARLVAERYCDGLGACLGECPTGALTIIEAEADEFDEAAVETLIASKKAKPHAALAPKAPGQMPCGCPGTAMHQFKPVTARTVTQTGQASTLAHWPIKIRLVPPNAPFLRGAQLLVAADCAPAATPNFHSEFLPGHAVLLGCPKFDDNEAHFQRFVEIFQQNDISSVTVLRMEVPCCASLERLVAQAAHAAGRHVAIEVAIVTRQGEITGRAPVEAGPGSSL